MAASLGAVSLICLLAAELVQWTGAPARAAARLEAAALLTAGLMPAWQAARGLWRGTYATGAILIVAAAGAAMSGRAADAALGLIVWGGLDGWQRRLWRTAWRRLARRASEEVLADAHRRALANAEKVAEPFLLVGTLTALALLVVPFLLGEPVSRWILRGSICLFLATPGPFFTASLVGPLVRARGAHWARVAAGGALVAAPVAKTALVTAAVAGHLSVGGAALAETLWVVTGAAGVLRLSRGMRRRRFESNDPDAYNEVDRRG
ncbi:MAG TPA: hypothetical protein VF234_08750 [Limnochordia bacterium]